MKVRGRLGGGAGDIKQVTILNRVLRWEEDGISIEADPKHVDFIIKGCGLTAGSNPVWTTGVKVYEEEEKEDEELPREAQRLFRALAARAKSEMFWMLMGMEIGLGAGSQGNRPAEV